MKSLHLNPTSDITYMTEKDAIALPRTHSGLLLLCDFLCFNPFSDLAWQTLFFDFDHLLGKFEREKMVGIIWIHIMERSDLLLAYIKHC